MEFHYVADGFTITLFAVYGLSANFLCVIFASELRLLPKSKVAVIVDNMHNQSTANVSAAGGQCCACPKTKEQQRIEDEERQFQIEFENFLQDTLYRKTCVAIHCHHLLCPLRVNACALRYCVNTAIIKNF